MHYEAVIGLEIHTQLATNSKMFCRCAVEYTDIPNKNVCPTCLGLPGALPTINRRAVEFAIKLGLVTHSTINLSSVFARKNYFYPDLPKSYQISQYDKPICENGWVEIEVGGHLKKIGLTRIHMEEDAGKLVHDGLDVNASYVDFGRAGVPLLEIVSEPELRTAEEAKAFMEKIYSLVTYLDICHGDLEKGNLRCDANVSLRKTGAEAFGTRTETKNINSFRFLQQAIEFEIARQQDVLVEGGKIVQETRLFNSATKSTFSMRVKENSDDYRYFACPDLPTIGIKNEQIESIKQNIPEMPDARKARFVEKYAIPIDDAAILVGDKAMAQYFEDTVSAGANPKKAANWLLGDVLKSLNEANISISKMSVRPKQMAKLIGLIDEGKISGKIAKSVFSQMLESAESLDPEQIIDKQGLSQISDLGLLEKMVQELVNAHPAEVADYRSGRDKVLGFFVGKIMAKTAGKANPKMINDLLLKALKRD